MQPLRLYSRENIDELKWPNTSDGKKLAAFFLPLFKEGVQNYISNVETTLFILETDHHLLPITVNEEEYDNAYLVSNYYALLMVEEWAIRKGAFKKIRKMAAALLAKVMKSAKINKCIIVNNLLLTTNLYPPLTESEVEEIISFLRKRFPQHLIFFRYVDLFINQELAKITKKNGCKLIKTRMVLGFNKNDPESAAKLRYHFRRDLRRVEANGYRIVRREEMTGEDFKRAIELYEKVYVTKHSPYSPRYTLSFLKNATNNEIFNLFGLKKEGRLDAVAAIFNYQDCSMNPFFGFDNSLPFELGLYPAIMTLMVEEAAKLGNPYLDGSGGELTKCQRGLKPYLEYQAIYDRHLPWGRRLFWSLSKVVSNSLLFPFIRREQFKHFQK